MRISNAKLSDCVDWCGVKTLRTQNTSDPRHFGTSAEVSIGTSSELSGHIGTVLWTLMVL